MQHAYRSTKWQDIRQPLDLFTGIGAVNVSNTVNGYGNRYSRYGAEVAELTATESRVSAPFTAVPTCSIHAPATRSQLSPQTRKCYGPN